MNDSGIEPGAARRGQSLPFRLKIAAQGGDPADERLLRNRFRLGYGDDCDIQLPGGRGPRVLFEVENARGPLLIARALPPEEFAHYVDVTIDGKPLAQSQQTLKPGARVDIVDKSSQRNYELVVDPPHPRAWFRPRNLAIVIALLTVLGAAFGGYLYRAVIGVRDDVERTSERIENAETQFKRTAQELLESVRLMGTSDAELASAVRELKRLQGVTSRTLHDEFARRISLIEGEARVELEQRAKMAEKAQIQLAELRAEFSQRMVSAYEQLKDVERNMLDAMAQRFAARGPSKAVLKSILAKSQDSVLFVRTQFQVRLGEASEPRKLESLGTGFMVESDGLAVTAQHVVYPWIYDTELLVLINLGLAEVIADSMRWSVWSRGLTVLEDPADPTSYNEADAYHSDGAKPKLRILAAPEPRLTKSAVSSPVGMVELSVALPGRTDVVVFQIDAGDTELPHLNLSNAQELVEPLDVVLALGYPFSRLEKGQAQPQGVRGFVRRVSDEMIEIDAAVHPGLSGGPLIDARGKVLGMLSATVGSEVYAIAVRARDLRTVLDTARERVR